MYKWYCVQCCTQHCTQYHLFSVHCTAHSIICTVYTVLHTVSFVQGKMHFDWFNGIEVLQGWWQHGEKVGYCYPSGLEKTLCKWDIYVPLVTEGSKALMPESVPKTKVLLFMHQFAACPHDRSYLQYMKFLFFTQNCTSILQLLDQGKTQVIEPLLPQAACKKHCFCGW